MKRQRSEHMVQSLFMITLLGLFFICAVGVIAMGASVYQKTSAESSTDYQVRTSLTYIAEKARQCDQGGGLAIGTLDDGTQALLLPASYGGTAYVTYIYAYEGTLRELFVKNDSPTQANAGSVIMNITEMELTEMENASDSDTSDLDSGTSDSDLADSENVLIQVSIVDEDQHMASVLLHSVSQKEAD